MPISRRRAVLFPCALAILAAACGERGPGTGGRRQPADEGPPVSGGSVVIGELSDMERPMPFFFQTTMDSGLGDMMYMGLTRMAWRGGKPVYMLSDESPMAIAHSWRYASPDSTAIRFHLRPGLRWSDGYPLTAHDVVWSFEAMRDPRTASARAGDVSLIRSVRAEDDTTVLFQFVRRSPSMLFQTSVPIAPRHAYDDAPRERLMTHPVFANPARMVVSGPFRIGSWRPNERITLVPNPYFRPRPRLEAVVIRVIPDPTARLTELETGRLDLARPVSTDHLEGLQRRMPDVRVLREEKRFWEFIGYNPERVEAFRDPQVRRALGLALDVPGIIRDLDLGEIVQQAYGPYPPIFRDLFDARDRPLPHDPAAARRILAERGWRDTDGDGVLEKDGRPFRFTLLTNTGNQRRADVSQMVQAQWRAIGVEARLQQQDQNTVFSREVEKDFEAALNGWAVSLDPDIGAFFEPGGHLNVVSYRNDEVTRLMEQARNAPTEREAGALWRAAAERIVQDQPYNWLYYYDLLSAAGPRLRGIRVDTFGAYQNVWEWWVPAHLQRRAAP